MDAQSRDLAKELRRLTSADALALLTRREDEGFPVSVQLLKSRSWKRPEQWCLARRYLKNLPHATSAVYDALLSFMRVEAFLEVVAEQWLDDRRRPELLSYYLAPALRRAVRTQRDRDAVERFILENLA